LLSTEAPRHNAQLLGIQFMRFVISAILLHSLVFKRPGLIVGHSFTFVKKYNNSLLK
jgi:hypothetical protein